MYMAKTLAILFGVVYVLMGIVGFFNTGLVGTAGVFAADALTSAMFVLVGAVLLTGGLATLARARNMNTLVGAVLVVLSLIGFLMVPDRGEMLGMFVSDSVHWFNLIVGAVLFGSGVYERRIERRYQYSVS